MTQFESSYKEFVQRNAGLVFIAAQKIRGLFKGKEHVDRHAYPFVVLFDEAREVSRAYGVYQALGVDTFNIARRSAFVIAPNGKICWIAVSPHQTEAPDLQQVLNAVDSCGA
jgi:peroxiredoxin